MDSRDERILTLASYIAETNATVRKAAEVYGVSKSTVHKDVTERLEHVNPYLYHEVQTVLQTNKAERHLRGGEATRLKYEILETLKKRKNV